MGMLLIYEEISPINKGVLRMENEKQSSLKKHDLVVVEDDGRKYLLRSYRQKTWLDHLLIIIGFVAVIIMTLRIETTMGVGSFIGYFIHLNKDQGQALYDGFSNVADPSVSSSPSTWWKLMYALNQIGKIAKTDLGANFLGMGAKYYCFFDTLVFSIILIAYNIILVLFSIYCIKDFVGLFRDINKGIRIFHRTTKESFKDLHDELRAEDEVPLVDSEKGEETVAAKPARGRKPKAKPADDPKPEPKADKPVSDPKPVPEKSEQEKILDALTSAEMDDYLSGKLTVEQAAALYRSRVNPVPKEEPAAVKPTEPLFPDEK
jgi:hypothetical protein